MMKALSMLAMAAVAHGTPEMNKLPNGDTKVRPAPVPAGGVGCVFLCGICTAA